MLSKSVAYFIYIALSVPLYNTISNKDNPVPKRNAKYAYLCISSTYKVKYTNVTWFHHSLLINITSPWTQKSFNI